MLLKKSWFYMVIYVIIFLTFMYLDSSIIKQPKLTWYLFLVAITFMIITSIAAIIFSFKNSKSSEGASKVFNFICFILSICLIIFALGWLGIILLMQYAI